MREHTNSEGQDRFGKIADHFGNSVDPLQEFDDQFKALNLDVFEVFVQEKVEPRNVTDRVVKRHRRNFDQWKDFMSHRSRHPACPRREDVLAFAYNRVETHTNDPKTVRRKKLGHLEQAFKHFQTNPAYPHTHEYNPVTAAKEDFNLESSDKKPQHRIPIETMGEIVGDIPHVRDRLIIGGACKWLARRGTMCNLRLDEIHLDHPDVLEAYPEMGTHPRVEDRENTIYIPHDRAGNKSERPRVLPLDDEARRMILEYLYIRPNTDEPWLLVNQKTGQQMSPDHVNERWKKYFRPEYEETEWYDAVTSHFGRHFSTTWWRVHQGLNEELLYYMRGDKPGKDLQEGQIPKYIHMHFDMIEERYLDGIFKFGL